jgi:hypothetical protein
VLRKGVRSFRTQPPTEPAQDGERSCADSTHRQSHPFRRLGTKHSLCTRVWEAHVQRPEAGESPGGSDDARSTPLGWDVGIDGYGPTGPGAFQSRGLRASKDPKQGPLQDGSDVALGSARQKALRIAIRLTFRGSAT